MFGVDLTWLDVLDALGGGYPHQHLWWAGWKF